MKKNSDVKQRGLSRQSSSGQSRPISEQLSKKELEFKQLNEDLERKRETLINEAESVFQDHEILFSNSPKPLISDDVSNLDLEPAEPLDKPPAGKSENIKSQRPSSSKQRPLSGKQQKPLSGTQQRPLSGKQKPLSGKQRTLSAVKQQSQSQTKEHKNTLPGKKKSEEVEERALFADRILSMQQKVDADDNDDSLYRPDEPVDQPSSDIGPEATIRFLKAKLRVMQEELEAIEVTCREKESVICEVTNNLKESGEEVKDLTKKNSTLHGTIEKYHKNQELLQEKNLQLETDFNNIKKELDELKREKKHDASSKNTLEIRLNRALEDAAKHKQAVQKVKDSTKSTNETDRRQLEQLKIQNKRLEKQKQELLTAFKKQLKLIDILKRQKMHIEAAKLLEFTEEEFVRVLEWGES